MKYPNIISTSQGLFNKYSFCWGIPGSAQELLLMVSIPYVVLGTESNKYIVGYFQENLGYENISKATEDINKRKP